jgi:uncharacterized protein YqgC (DUF456 family)
LNDENKGAKRGRQIRDVGIYTTIPTMLVVGPVLGYFLGRWAGQRWGDENLMEAAGLFLGLLASIRQIWVILRTHGKIS